jgi:hypothetical protein
MKGFFTILYITSNRFSSEKIAIGILANINGIPHFHYSERKLNFALSRVSTHLKSGVKKGLRFMEFDVNKIKRGEETLDLFDPPFARKKLKELSLKKRGLLTYSELFELYDDKTISFDLLYAKMIGENIINAPKAALKSNLINQFRLLSKDRKFAEFDRNFKLKANEFPYIYKDVSVHLMRLTSYYTVFYHIDFTSSINAIQNNLTKFRTIVQSLQQKALESGLSKGRFYLVYESTTNKAKQQLIAQIRREVNLGFELIRLSEMKDKV